MKTTLFILVSFLIVFTNIVIGHFFAPYGILYTPIVLSIVSLIIIATKETGLIFKGVLISLFIIMNDVGIKLYSGGIHDYEGLAWIHIFFLIGLILSYIILITGILLARHSSLRQKIAAALTLPVIITIHMYFFTELGITAR